MSLATKLLITAMLLLALLTTFLIKRNMVLKQEVEDKTVTIRSLESGITQYKDKFGDIYTRSMNQVRTAQDLAASKDSVIANMLVKLHNANIKLKDVVSIGTVVTKLVTDTNIVYRGVNKDTTYNLSIPPHLYETITIKNNNLNRKLEINDRVTTFSVLERETVDPPKKFFLWRWFQEKHNVLYTDIVRTNPLIQTNESTQITVLGKDGRPKTR